MRALRYDRFGSPDAVRVGEAPSPLPADDEVAVRVHAASLNPLDWKIQRGDMRFVPLFARPPRGVGVDFAGEVVARGERAKGFDVGDRVFGALSPFARQGSIAERVVVTSDLIATMPPQLDFAGAASLPIAGGTALQGIVDHAHVERGARVLITGAAGGVGGYAVQIARYLGAHVTGVASTANLEYVASLGADAVLDYTTDDFTRESERYDVVFDAAAASSFSTARRVLAADGVYITTTPELASVAAGTWARMTSHQRFVALMLRRADAMWRRLAELVNSDALRPTVARSIAMDDVADALAAMRSGHGRGKIVVAIDTPVEQ